MCGAPGGRSPLASPIMAYPDRLLSPGEVIVEEFRPHWQVLVIPVTALVVAIVAIVLAVMQLTGTTQTVVVIGVIVVWVVISTQKFADWLTTKYVITNERVVYRAGVFARAGIEIPLESITNVSFRQSFLERMVRSGDLVIESAGEDGQSRYTNVPDPEGLQSLIYQQRENRTLALAKGNVSVAEELERLAALRDRGVLSDEEFEAQKRRLLEQ